MAARRWIISRPTSPTSASSDVHMPGLTGVEAARKIGARAHLVFVTAFDQ